MKTNRAAELLEKSVTRIMNSDEYKAALTFRAKLPRYSFRNVWLLYFQKPDISMVAGYKVWQSHGRQVRKGEKGLCIFAPMTRKNSDGEAELFGFKTASVFDLSQTDGESVPETPRPLRLTGEGYTERACLDTLEHHLKCEGYSVKRATLPGETNGCIYYKEKAIVLREGLASAQALKTLVHEYAHGLMHAKATKDTPNDVRELEAESCAYIVCDSLGLDTSGYSFNYLAGWASDPKDVLPAAQKACKTADTILELFTPAPVALAA